MALISDITKAIGNTPLVKINNPESQANIYAKAEYFNPLGSVKDRAAFYMIKTAFEQGLIKKGSVIVEPTSGNTGIALAYIGAQLGLKVILTMPDTLSVERRTMLKQLGAQLVLTDGKLGMPCAVEKAKEIRAQTPGSFIPDQFSNPANALAHYETTAPEIWRDLDGKLDVFIAGAGTGGTISGCGLYFKEKNPDIKIIAVEPASSPVLSGGKAGPHKIQGIGAGFVPALYNKNVVDEVLQIKDDDALAAVKLLHAQGLYAGISSGAAFFAALEVAGRAGNEGKNIVFILPDSASRYLSVL